MNGFVSGCARTFADPFAAWHYRTLGKSMYFIDVDGVEVEWKYPVILYEVKTISQSLYRAVMASDVLSSTVLADFFGRVNLWQLEVLERMLKPFLQSGFLILTPPTCEGFFMMAFWDAYHELGTHGEYPGHLRQLLDEGRPAADVVQKWPPRLLACRYGPLREAIISPDAFTKLLIARRRWHADLWRWAEAHGAADDWHAISRELKRREEEKGRLRRLAEGRPRGEPNSYWELKRKQDAQDARLRLHLVKGAQVSA